MYDLVSPGHVLSVHESAAKATLLALHGGSIYSQMDFDNWGDGSLLERALVITGGHIGGTVGQDLSVVPRLYEVHFNEPQSYRPQSVRTLLGRRQISSFSFLGAMLMTKQHHPVFAVLYVSDGVPRAYIPTSGNALTKAKPIVDDDTDFAYNSAAMVADLRSHLKIQ